MDFAIGVRELLTDYTNRLKKHRLMRMYTQKQVADGMSIALGCYRDIESGRLNFKVTEAMSLASFYHISLDELLGFGEYDTGGYLDGMA
jgi:DNA-binding XRE family transcriptional regulator